ncbi:3365_t:CDS:2 [Entrophospora sp. SA101]|nr:3365_t:CDS:2 [Entrophospora sp. SA101]
MKRTTFLKQIKDGPFIYREDLGGLCSICCEFGYEVFDDLKKLISVHIVDKSNQDCLYSKIDIIKWHYKREYELELEINNDGTIQHNNCINHCLTFAFGICTQPHTTICLKCSQLYEFFHN